MTSTLFPKSLRFGKRTKLENVTLRGFSGGWNAVDDDISMAAKYLVEARNVYRTASGAQTIRPGNKFFTDVADVVTGDIVDQIYFNGRIISVTTTGEIAASDDDGTNTAIWNSGIAAALSGSPAGWSSGLEYVDFTPHKNALVIHNGVDKPLEVTSAFVVSYLADAATGSNVAVPIGKYGCVVSNYHCIAGIPGLPTTIYISSSGTRGTFPGDPAPNDSISIDVGAYAPEGAAEIRGIAGFRNNLMVFVQGLTILVTLGEFNEAGVHVPVFPDTLPEFGLLGHRDITIIENDMLFGGIGGLASAKRNLYTTTTLDSELLSGIIEPRWRRLVGALTETEMLRDTFSIHDPLNHNWLLFEPNGDVIVYTVDEKLKMREWSRWTELDFDCGCTSFLGRVFLSKGSKIYQMGNQIYPNENYHADLIGDYDSVWATSIHFAVDDRVYDPDTEEVYTCLVDHVSSAVGTFADARDNFPDNWELYEGQEIEFEMELPWFDGKNPLITKHLKFINAATKGTAEFTIDMYVDNLFKDSTGAVVHDPALSMIFIGNDADGFGTDVGGFGGGRRSGDPRLYNYPAKFKMAKFILSGSTMDPLTVINISFLYAKLAFQR